VKIVAHSGMQSIANKLQKIVSSDPLKAKELSGMEFKIGPASDPDFQTDASALGGALFVGDSMIGEVVTNATLDAQAKADPNSVGVFPKYNPQSRKFDLIAVDRKTALIGDAAPNLLASQLLSPSAAGWMNEYFKRPLIKSKARQMVSIQTGNDPWASVLNMGMLDFSGFAALGSTGAPNNRMSTDVEVQSGVMSTPIINMEASWKIAVEEMERSKSGNAAPWAGKAIAYKQSYADYCLDMLTNALIYYGNTATGTMGLLSLNGATAWSGVGSSMTTIAAGASTTKGSDMYSLLAGVLADFLTVNQNMINKVVVNMSPRAINILGKTAYSASYNPKSVLTILKENFESGENTNGVIANIEFNADPLLDATQGGVVNIFNSNATDYLMLTSPEIDNGLDNEKQSLIIGAMPLEKFTYPVIPGQYSTPHKTLRRYGGLFMPYTPAVKVYSGFGV
jgi:hypothetical protein